MRPLACQADDLPARRTSLCFWETLLRGSLRVADAFFDGKGIQIDESEDEEEEEEEEEAEEEEEEGSAAAAAVKDEDTAGGGDELDDAAVV